MQNIKPKAAYLGSSLQNKLRLIQNKRLSLRAWDEVL